MASSLGHGLCGVACLLAVAACRRRFAVPVTLRMLVLCAVLANLPDLDFLIGYWLAGDVHAFHSGPTHSLLFALVAGGLVALAVRVKPYSYALTSLFFALIIFSHVLMDALTGPTLGLHPSNGVPIAWPLSNLRQMAMPFTLFVGVAHDDWARLVSWHNLRTMAIELLMFAPIILLLLGVHLRQQRMIAPQARAHLETVGNQSNP